MSIFEQVDGLVGTTFEELEALAEDHGGFIAMRLVSADGIYADDDGTEPLWEPQVCVVIDEADGMVVTFMSMVTPGEGEQLELSGDGSRYILRGAELEAAIKRARA